MAIYLPELGLGININSTNSHEFRRWLAMPLDFILQKDKRGINHNSKILHGTSLYFCISRVQKGRRVSGNKWDDQQTKENDGSFVSTKDISKFQKFGIRV